MTILITGVAGFIGAHVAKALLAQGRTVIGFDNLNHYYTSQLKQDRLASLCAQGDFSFHEVDVASPVAPHLALGRRIEKAIAHRRPGLGKVTQAHSTGASSLAAFLALASRIASSAD